MILDAVDGRRLPAVAREAVEDALEADELPPPSARPTSSNEPTFATFVTIKKDGKLRGCMGTTVPRRPLLEDVKSQARAAAFRDPRFEPIEPDELSELHFEVSVLGEPQQLDVTDFQDACAKIRPGRDGVIVRTAVGGALFLPQVWEIFEVPADFLDQLWKKAGLPHRYFESDLKLSVFPVEKFEEPSK